jgi:hypothetical protein
MVRREVIIKILKCEIDLPIVENSKEIILIDRRTVLDQCSEEGVEELRRGIMLFKADRETVDRCPAVVELVKLSVTVLLIVLTEEGDVLHHHRFTRAIRSV